MEGKPRVRDTKPPAKNPATRPQPHGGSLAVPGNPGNRGGGRPRSLIRRDAADLFDKVYLDYLRGVVSDPAAKPGDKINAANLLAKFVGFPAAGEEDEEDVVNLPAVTFPVEASPPVVED